MGKSQFRLLARRRFLPLFVTQFLGAFNDNLFKNALVILILYRLAAESGTDGQILVTIAAGIFILPFFLFSATAGQLADKLEKARLIRLTKIAEVVIMGLAVAGFQLGDPMVLLVVLFLMGTQSTFFGPLKYAILPDHLAADDLIGGNALIEAGTFLAILIGTILGGVLILRANGIVVVSTAVVALAVSGWIASTFIPQAPPPAPNLAIDRNIIGATWRLVGAATAFRDIRLAILGISWFWLVGATFLAQFPNFAKGVIGGDQYVVTLFLASFSVGIGVGSLLCNWLLRGAVSARYVPFAALGMTVFIADLYLASRNMVPAPGALKGVAAFIAEPAGWRVLGDLLAIAVCGGIYIVPLYAILQSRSARTERSRAIAANNVLNALFMVLGAIAAILMLKGGLSVPMVFLVTGILNGGVALVVHRSRKRGII